MSSFTHPPLFAELVPLSLYAHSSTLLPSNMRYVRIAKDGEHEPKARLVQFTFGVIAGRYCLSFGTSRSSDYMLPVSNGVASHHFILFLNVYNHYL